MSIKEDEKELLHRFGWMLFDDINRRLGILIEECCHLQQVVHYHGDFDISDTDTNQQREMEHFKQTNSYAHEKSFAFVSEALYEHLGGLILGLKSLKTEVRKRFEDFLNTTDIDQHKKWFWFIALRGHLLQDVLDKYMVLLEHAHEKQIQILETKPGQLPQAILMRRWNSALHGRYLSEYSRHIDWETNVLFNSLKKHPLSNKKLIASRHQSSFIHSWAHTPTSMVNYFFVKDRNPKTNKEEHYKLGSIRSAFFYLEMPQLYPLLYHECAHLQFEWDTEAVEDKGVFFINRRNAIKTLEEQCIIYHVDIQGGWENFVGEICADTLAISLGSISYFTALVMQLMGQGSGCFFYSDSSLPLQEWAKQPIYDLEQPETQEYFWQARLMLALNCLEKEHPQDLEEPDNKQWLKAVKAGINAYHQGGKAVFTAQRVSAQHQEFWQYRKLLNDWVFKTIKKCNLPDSIDKDIRRDKIYSNKYQLDKSVIKDVLSPSVQNFEKQFFNKNHKYRNKSCEHSISLRAENGKTASIEYLTFHVKWYLSKRVIKEITSIKEGTSKNESLETFTYTYANFICDSSTSIFRLALEWLIARNDLYNTFIDYLGDREAIKVQFKKLDLVPPALEDKLKEIASDEKAKKKLIHHLRYRSKSKNLKNWEVNKVIKELDIFIEQYMKENIVACFKKLHVENDDKQVSIGTFTLGSFSKHRIISIDPTKSLYLEGVKAVYDNYQAIKQSINNPGMLCNHAGMPFDYKNNEKFFLPDIGSESNQSQLYFITGDYDFMHHQVGITPSEFTCHPFRKQPILTKSRTVLDICKHFKDEKGNEIERQACGRISLIKFRYRWEMYHLATYLKKQPYRSRLRLSSAWEDGVLSTWHKDVDIFWKEAYHQWGSQVEPGGSMDTQSSLILFKLDDNSEVGENRNPPVSVHNGTRIGFDKINVTDKKLELPEIIKELSERSAGLSSINSSETEEGSTNNPTIPDENKKTNIFKNVYISQGRFDYTIEWDVKNPMDLAKLMFRLPDEFWKNIAHINTAFVQNKNNVADSLFISEISINMFPPIKKIT